jgi:hypothetical protein
LSGADIAPLQHPKFSHCFSVTRTPTGKEFQIYAESARDFSEWLTVLRLAASGSVDPAMTNLAGDEGSPISLGTPASPRSPRSSKQSSAPGSPPPVSLNESQPVVSSPPRASLAHAASPVISPAAAPLAASTPPAAAAAAAAPVAPPAPFAASVPIAADLGADLDAMHLNDADASPQEGRVLATVAIRDQPIVAAAVPQQRLSALSAAVARSLAAASPLSAGSGGGGDHADLSVASGGSGSRPHSLHFSNDVVASSLPMNIASQARRRTASMPMPASLRLRASSVSSSPTALSLLQQAHGTPPTLFDALYISDEEGEQADGAVRAGGNGSVVGVLRRELSGRSLGSRRDSSPRVSAHGAGSPLAGEMLLGADSPLEPSSLRGSLLELVGAPPPPPSPPLLPGMPADTPGAILPPRPQQAPPPPPILMAPTVKPQHSPPPPSPLTLVPQQRDPFGAADLRNIAAYQQRRGGGGHDAGPEQ